MLLQFQTFCCRSVSIGFEEKLQLWFFDEWVSLLSRPLPHIGVWRQQQCWWSPDGCMHQRLHGLTCIGLSVSEVKAVWGVFDKMLFNYVYIWRLQPVSVHVHKVLAETSHHSMFLRMPSSLMCLVQVLSL